MSGLAERPLALRRGRTADAEACARIEALCAAQFRDSAHPEVAERASPPPAAHAAAAERGGLWVAQSEGRIVGFAIVAAGDGALHIRELDVDPRFQRRGVARALLERLAEAARDETLGALTLTTFRDVPWNAPAYARMGFSVLPEPDWTPACREERDAIAAPGYEVSARVAMIRRL